MVTAGDADDELYRGAYYPRRGNDCSEGKECVSVEPAEAFGGPPGELWVVGALTTGPGPTAFTANRLGHAEQRPFWLFIGCMH